MRIKEDLFEDNAAYTHKLRRRAAEVLEQACLLHEMRQLLQSIRKEALALREVFLSEEEQKEIESVLSNFDSRMQMMALGTCYNLEQYRLISWKEFFEIGGDEGNE